MNKLRIKDQAEVLNTLNTLKSDNNNNKKLEIKKYVYDDDNALFISKQKEMFNKLVDDRIEKITDLDEKVNSDDLVYRDQGDIDDVNFDEFDDALDIIKKLRDGKKDLADVKYNQQNFKYLFRKKKKGNKSKEQNDTLYNIEMLYNARDETKLLNFMMIVL